MGKSEAELDDDFFKTDEPVADTSLSFSYCKDVQLQAGDITSRYGPLPAPVTAALGGLTLRAIESWQDTVEGVCHTWAAVTLTTLATALERRALPVSSAWLRGLHQGLMEANPNLSAASLEPTIELRIGQQVISAPESGL